MSWRPKRRCVRFFDDEWVQEDEKDHSVAFEALTFFPDEIYDIVSSYLATNLSELAALVGSMCGADVYDSDMPRVFYILVLGTSGYIDKNRFHWTTMQEIHEIIRVHSNTQPFYSIMALYFMLVYLQPRNGFVVLIPISRDHVFSIATNRILAHHELIAVLHAFNFVLRNLTANRVHLREPWIMFDTDRSLRRSLTAYMDSMHGADTYVHFWMELLLVDVVRDYCSLDNCKGSIRAPSP